MANPRPIATTLATPTPALSKRVSTNRVSTKRVTGAATWFCLPGRSACTVGYPASGAYAAAGPRLRSAIGPSWRGRTVTVCTPDCIAPRVTASVRLVDWCACPGDHLIDLYASVFGALAPLTAGEASVEVAW